MSENNDLQLETWPKPELRYGEYAKRETGK